MSTSISCTATTRTCRSASSSTPWIAEVKAGRIRGPFGGSNWTASAWTRRSPMPSGPASRSPARSPTISRWPKCWSRSGPAASPPPTDDWKAWLTARQMPNFAWSSQGRGFFTDRAGRDKRDNEELVRRLVLRARISSAATARSSWRKQARQEPDPHRARLCAGAALPVDPADRPAHARRAGRQPQGARHRAVAGRSRVAGRRATGAGTARRGVAPDKAASPRRTAGISRRDLQCPLVSGCCAT